MITCEGFLRISWKKCHMNVTGNLTGLEDRWLVFLFPPLSFFVTHKICGKLGKPWGCRWVSFRVRESQSKKKKGFYFSKKNFHFYLVCFNILFFI